MTRRTSTSLAGCRVAAEHRTAAALGCRSRSDEADAALLRAKSRAAEAGASAPPVGGRLAEPAQACLAGPDRARECRPAPMADTSRSLATATRWAPWRATVALLAGSTPADSWNDAGTWLARAACAPPSRPRAEGFASCCCHTLAGGGGRPRSRPRRRRRNRRRLRKRTFSCAAAHAWPTDHTRNRVLRTAQWTA